jgi:hypothetical protein
LQKLSHLDAARCVPSEGRIPPHLAEARTARQ